MRAALFEGAGTDLRVVDIDVEEPRAGEVRVKVSHCGVCHSDLHVVDGGIPSPLPVVLGHEAAGVVEAVGPGVQGLAEGDHVILTLQPQCNRCAACARGDVHLCEVYGGVLTTAAMIDGGTRLSMDGKTVYRGMGLGGYAEVVVTPASAAVKVPDDTPLHLACLLGCAVQTGVGAVLNTAKVDRGDTVAVIGLGGVGISAVQGARIAGAAKIIGVDPVAARRESAGALGATDVLDPTANELAAVFPGVDHVIDTVASPATIGGGLLALRGGGSVIVVGVPKFTDTIELPTIFWTSFEKSVKGSYLGSSNPHREFPRLLALWRSGKLDLEAMVTNTRPLEQLQAAFDDMKAGQGIRTVIDLSA